MTFEIPKSKLIIPEPNLEIKALESQGKNLPSTSKVNLNTCISKGTFSEAENKAGLVQEQAQLIQKFKLNFTVNEECFNKLEKVKSALSGKYPKGASLEDVFSELLSFYLEKQSSKRKLKTPKAAPGQRIYLLKALRQKILKDSDYSCTFIGTSGVKCGSRHDLEIDHIIPLAKGGSNEEANMRVLCAKHNKLMAQRHFGRGFHSY